MNKDPILNVTEDGRFREHETLSEVHPILIIWEVKGGEEMLTAKVLGRTGTVIPGTIEPHIFMDHMWRREVELGVQEGFQRQNAITSP